MKGLDEDECSVKPVPFTVQYIKCVFFPLFFLLPMVFPFTTGLSFRVLRTVFVPGWGGPFKFITLCLSVVSPLLTFISCHSLPDLFCSCPLVHSFLSLPDLLLTSSSSFSPFLHVFLHIFLIPLPLSLPQRSHGSLVVCLLEGIPTPPPPPLEPRSFLLCSLPFPLSLYLFFYFFLHLFLMWKF